MISILPVRLSVLCFLIVPTLAVAQSPLRVETARFAAPTAIATLDMGKLKGEPARLAWSPDGTELYLQTREGAFGQANAKLRHYVFAAANGSKRDLDAEPDWASAYWTAKSAQASPDDPGIKIELKTERRQQRTTSVPMGGDMARGGASTAETGTSAGDAGAAAYGSQAATAHLMQLKGVVVGEFVNSVIVPGLTFGWGPQGSRAIAFAAQKSGRVTVMDDRGGTHEIAGSKDAILPAWSADGASLAWLQPDGRKKFALQVARVSPTS
jgi:hypothetical protein